jgi:outer membrane protein OmpA-like peptidoglycan-associated protein
MRTFSTLFLMAVMASSCARESEPERASTPEAAVASGSEAPCGSAQVFFAPGSSELDDAGRERLDVYAGCIARQEVDVVYVAGMTDPDGTEHDNLVLGRARALAVADYLRGSGVTADFVVRTMGEEGAVGSAPLWPIERSAEATAVAAP